MGKGVSLKQPSFAGGIISPQALGRTDQQKYAAGARALINAWVTRFGTIENRPGSGYCGSVKDASTTVRLVPFNSFLGTSYVLEFGYTAGAGYVRPWKNGARIAVGTPSNWSPFANYVPGDLVHDAGAGRNFWCIQANTGDQPSLFPAYWYIQGTDGFLELPTSLPATALPVMQFVQQNDVLTYVSQFNAPGQLLHYSDTRWVVQAFAQSTGIAAPVAAAVAGFPVTILTAPVPSATGGVLGGGTPDLYQMIAYKNAPSGFSAVANFQSASGLDAVASGGSPIAISWAAIAGADGYVIYCQRAGSAAFGILAVVEGATSFSDNASIVPAKIIQTPAGNPAGALYSYIVTAISSTTGAESLASNTATCMCSTSPTADHPNVISWSAVAGASKYNVYRVVNGVPGFIGQQPASPFSDINIIPDTTKQPPSALSLFATSSDWPAVVAYYQQRLCFANTVNQPSTVWMSRVGIYTAFTVGTPVLDDDAISFTIAGKQVQPIQAMVDLGKLIVHSSNAEYQVTGNAAGVITPTSVGVVNTGSAGSSLIAPVVIGNTDLFVQQGATRLNDLRYEVQRFTFAGKDLTKYATDLFRGRTIVAMDWQKLPHSIVWCALDNGAMVGLTYVGEDELYAWHQHASTNGAFEQVAVVIEGTQHVLYAVVRRTINGATARYLERFASRDCIDSILFTDSQFLDASLVFDGRNTNPAHTATLSTGAGWTSADTLTVTLSNGAFVSGDVGNSVVFQQIDATTGLVSDQVTVKILGYTSATVVTGRAQRAVPTWAQGVALTTWGKAVRSFSGIGHLEGQSIGVLADGSVLADPLDPRYPALTVTAGAFTLTDPALVVCAGLPMQTDVETLPLENATGETISNRRITVRECTPIFYASRGGFFGQDVAHLDPWVGPTTHTTGYPPQVVTGPSRVPIRGAPQRTGQVYIRHTEPTPFAFSAIVLTCELGD